MVDTSTGEFICLAKGWGCAWESWKSEMVEDFLSTRFNDGDGPTNLKVFTEYDDELYEKWIDAKNIYKH